MFNLKILPILTKSSILKISFILKILSIFKILSIQKIPSFWNILTLNAATVESPCSAGYFTAEARHDAFKYCVSWKYLPSLIHRQFWNILQVISLQKRDTSSLQKAKKQEQNLSKMESQLFKANKRWENWVIRQYFVSRIDHNAVKMGWKSNHIFNACWKWRASSSRPKFQNYFEGARSLNSKVGEFEGTHRPEWEVSLRWGASSAILFNTHRNLSKRHIIEKDNTKTKRCEEFVFAGDPGAPQAIQRSHPADQAGSWSAIVIISN